MKSSRIFTALFWACTGIRLLADPNDSGHNPLVKVESAIAKTLTPLVGSEITVRFDKAIDAETAGNVSNYSLRQITPEMDDSISGLLEDIDGDGDSDMVLALGNQIVVHTNWGNQTSPFYESSKILLATIKYIWAPGEVLDSSSRSTVAFGDLDNDGDRDLIVCEGDSGNISCFLRNSASNTWPAYGNQALTFHLDSSGPKVIGRKRHGGFRTHQILAQDLDGDGTVDLIVGESYDSMYYQLHPEDGIRYSLEYYKGTGQFIQNESLIFEYPIQLQAGGVPIFLGDQTGCAMPALADIDGDNDQDLVVGTTWGEIWTYKAVGVNLDTNSDNLGLPLFQEGELLLEIPEESYTIEDLNDFYRYDEITSMQVVDHSGDGDKDIIAVIRDRQLPTGGALSIFENSQRNGFSFPESPAAISISEHSRNIGFEYSHSKPIYFDFDGDKKIDILYADESYGIIIYYNMDTGEDHHPSYPKATKISISQNLKEKLNDCSIDIVDFDQDGVLDPNVDGLLAGPSSDLLFIKYLGTSANGLPLFDESISIIPSGFEAPRRLSPTTGDVDGDHIIDIVFVKRLPYFTDHGKLYFMKNNSPDHFNLSVPILIEISGLEGQLPLYGHITYPEISDCDGDGDGDLLVSDREAWEQTYFSNFPSHYIRYLRNDGGLVPTFSNQGFLLNYYGEPISVLYNAFPRVVDFNNDGHDDVLVSSRDGSISPFISAPEFTDPELPDPPIFLDASPTLKSSGMLPTEVVLSGDRRTVNLKFSTVINDRSKLDLNDLFVQGEEAAILSVNVQHANRDTDRDGLSDLVEIGIGSSIYFADTDRDGISDFDEVEVGTPPTGDGSDDDGDGLPDEDLYAVVFEITNESRTLSKSPGYNVLNGTDNSKRYFVSETVVEYEVEGSYQYSGGAGKHATKSSYVVGGLLTEDGAPVTTETGKSLSDWLASRGIPLQAGERLDIESSSTDSSTSTTQTEVITTTTTTTEWTTYKRDPVTGDDKLSRKGPEVIKVITTEKLSSPFTIQDLWNTHMPKTWVQSDPVVLGPKSSPNPYESEAATAEWIRRSYELGDYNINGTISYAASTPNSHNLYIWQIKQFRWRWVRFNPSNPFEYTYAAPPAALKKKFQFFINEKNEVFAGANYQSPLVSESIPKGFIEVECKNTEGEDWTDVPPTEFAAYKVDEPKHFELYDFVKYGSTQVLFENVGARFITGGGSSASNATSLPESLGTPSVRLESISSSDVQVTGDTATVSIAGKVYDAIMGSMPAGAGADIDTIKVFLNGAETDFEGTLQRTNELKSFWAPYGPEAMIQPFTVTMPSSGMNRITVETSANAAGIKGRAEFDVVFDKEFSTALTRPGQSFSVDLLLPPIFSDAIREIVQIALPGQGATDNLEETTATSRIFTSAQTGATIVIAQSFQPSSSLDSLSCDVLFPSNISAGGIGMTASVLCTETGTSTLRFSCTINIAAHSESADYNWALASVSMSDQAYESMSHPIAFRRNSVNLSQNINLELFGKNFSISHDNENGFLCASTAPGKSLIGFLVRKENESGPSTRQFVYYDHGAASMIREDLPAAGMHLSYKLKTADIFSEEGELPIVNWRLLNLNGTPSEGLVSVSIESLIALAQGDHSIEIPGEAQAIIEVTGREAGEVLRVFSPEEITDRFDLTIPGATPSIPLSSKSTALTASGDKRYRSQQNLVIYCGGGTGPQTLNDGQWNALKGLGYLALHNAEPVIATTKDLAWALEEFGPANLPSGPDAPPMGVHGVTDPKNAQFYRFDGYDDHHVFNQYKDNLPKRERWTTIFGKDFDVDEFTVPVKQKYHRKIGHQITNEWEAFLELSFDDNHQLKPGVDVQQLRRDALNKMREIHRTWGIDTSRMRPYPQVLDPRRPRTLLCDRLITNGGEMGCSMDKFKVIDEMAFGPVLKGSDVARNTWWKDSAKKIFKRSGRSRVGKLIPIISTAMTVSALASASIDVNQVGWEEAAAQAVNTQLGLDDIELARAAVNSQFNTGAIAGGTPRPVLPLPNGQVIGMNERTYICYWNTNGQISKVVPYVVTEIKVFPDGSTKIAKKMEVPPFETLIDENPRFLVRDYWPAVGDSKDLYFQASARALANAGGGP